MRDITHKHPTLRTALAEGILRVGPEGFSALEDGQVPKGDPFEITKTAIMNGTKLTPDLIPYCHPIRVENVDVDFQLGDATVSIRVKVQASEKTGMEMEAMTAVSVGLLNLYDLLKPVEDDLEIEGIELVNKSGGYSDFRDRPLGDGSLEGLILLASPGDTTPEEDSTEVLIERLEREGLTIDDTLVASTEEELRNQLKTACQNNADFVATLGGIGPDIDAFTADVTREVIDRDLPGISQAMRDYCQQRTPYAMFSRAIAGQKNGTLIVNFPGRSDMVQLTLEALFPGLAKYFKCAQDDFDTDY